MKSDTERETDGKLKDEQWVHQCSKGVGERQRGMILIGDEVRDGENLLTDSRAGNIGEPT